MSVPKLNWVRQNQISFDVGNMGNPAIVSGSDDYIYFAAFVKGTNTSLSTPPPSIQYWYNQYASATSSYNLVVGKYYPNGPFKLVWYQYFYEITTTSDSSEISMVIGKDDELYVAFTTTGSTPQNLNMALVPAFGSCTCTPLGYKDVVVARINTNNTPSVAWLVQSAYINSCNDESAPQLAIDTQNGLLYLAYQCNKNILCNPAIGLSNVLVSCFDLNSKQLWIETGVNINSVGNNDNPTIVADLSGGVYVAYEVTRTVLGGASVTRRQIEMIKFQNNVVSYGVVNGYTRSWVLSSKSNIFSTGISTTPVLTFRNSTIFLGFITTGQVTGGTSTATHDMVIGSLTTDGALIWLRQGTQFNQTSYRYTDCFTPFITTDSNGFVYMSILTVSPGTDIYGSPSINGNVLLFKLDVATGTPFYNTIYKTKTYNVYPFARQASPNAAFPVPAPPGSFSRLAVTFSGHDMYAVVTTTQAAPGQTKTSPTYDLCFLAYDRILVLISTTPFSFMLKNKSICACAGACGCTAGITTPSIVYGVLMDTLTVASTNLSSTWYINVDSITTVQYYSTNSSVPAGGTPVGVFQTLPPGPTTNTLSPPYMPIVGTYYYCIVTPQYGLSVYSQIALLMPGIYNVVMIPVNDTSTSLSSTWQSTSPYIVIVQYYSRPSSGQSGGTPYGLVQYVGNGTISGSNSLTIPINAGVYYYVGVTPIQNYSGVYNVTMAPITDTSTSLSCTWQITFPSIVLIEYFTLTSPEQSSGTSFGLPQYVGGDLSGSNTITVPITAGLYYYVGITPVENYSGVYNLIMTPITDTSTSLSCTWQITFPSIVLIQYFTLTSPEQSSGTPFGVPQYVRVDLSGSNTTIIPITTGLYYYVGITPIENYSGVYNITMTPITDTSTSLSCTWQTTIPYKVRVQYYSTSLPSIVGTPYGSVQYAGQGVTSNTLTIPITAGLYYYVGITPYV